MDSEILQEVSKFYRIMSVKKDKRNEVKLYRFSVVENFAKLLKEYGLSNTNSLTKFIPADALLSSVEYRKKLLAGLIDTAYF